MILGDTGDTGQTNIDTVFESFTKSFEESTSFMVTGRIARREVKSRLNAIHNQSGIPCTLQIDFNANKIESAQIIRNCLGHSPICKSYMLYQFNWLPVKTENTLTPCVHLNISVHRPSSDCIYSCLATHIN